MLWQLPEQEKDLSVVLVSEICLFNALRMGIVSEGLKMERSLKKPIIMLNVIRVTVIESQEDSFSLIRHLYDKNTGKQN